MRPVSHGEDFSPDDLSIQVRDNGQLRLVWKKDSGERRAVILDRNQLPAVLHELQKQIEVAPSASTDLLALLAEKPARVTGLGFAPQHQSFRLTAFVDLPEQDKGFAISLLLSRADVQKCVSAMGHWLEQPHLDG
jgi:hypothetical protein